ncbi:MAG: pitrilysin family protein [Bacteroidota bacterium]
MDNLNRKIAPESNSISSMNLIQGSKYLTKNNIPFHYIHVPESLVLKVDFVFHGGLRNQLFNGQASATGSLLTEGTSIYSAKELADNLDAFGAYLQSKTNVDDSQLTLYCLPKFLPRVMGYILSVLTDCSFPEKEIDTYKTNAIQRFSVNLQRNSFLNRRAFYSSIFGNGNAYGSAVNQEDYANISRETVSSFYSNNILPGIKYVLISGEASGPVLTELESALSHFSSSPVDAKAIILPANSPHELFIENEYSVQSAIRIGRQLFGRKHSDFKKMQVLNMALGGFFGSRLMRNIREEKGLTYGIYSAMESYWDGGAFYIETEMNNELRNTGVIEILKEISLLRENPLANDELILVKNYLLGSFLRSIDGPFSLADRYKMILDYGFTYDYYNEFVETIRSISASEIQELANTYLQEKDLTTVIVGRK